VIGANAQLSLGGRKRKEVLETWDSTEIVGSEEVKRLFGNRGGLKKMERTDWRMMFEEDVLLLGGVLKKEKVKKAAKNR
jgi:hypothetical protein